MCFVSSDIRHRDRKHNVHFDPASYLDWLRSAPIEDSSKEEPSMSSRTHSTEDHPAQVSISKAEPAAPYPTSFSQIVDLITNGQPVPGIREIPDTLLTGRESQATTARRKKPWERDIAVEESGQDGAIERS